jgi:colanic acid biosynthesis glycosyl transferase WcaI
MRIVFFNRFFGHDGPASGELLADLATFLAEGGHDIHVVTSTGVSPSAAVVIHQPSTYRHRDGTLFARASEYLTFACYARRMARRLLRAGDVAITMTDPPLLSHAVEVGAAMAGARHILWMQDLYPEVAEVHLPALIRPMAPILRKMRNRSIEGSFCTVAISDGMATRLRAAGAPPCRIQVISNWTDGELIQPKPAVESRLRCALDLKDRFVVAYSGNFGRIHEFETLLGAARRLNAASNVTFLFIGDGPRLGQVRKTAGAERLENVLFLPRQPRISLADSLAAADVHISTLRRDMDGMAFPSKIHGILAAGRPCIFIGDPRGDCAEILAGPVAGFCIATGAIDELCERILRLRDNAEERTAMGKHARAAFEARHAQSRQMDRWRRLLEAPQESPLNSPTN